MEAIVIWKYLDWNWPGTGSGTGRYIIAATVILLTSIGLPQLQSQLQNPWASLSLKNECPSLMNLLAKTLVHYISQKLNGVTKILK